MQRHCDGKDVNLTRPLHKGEQARGLWPDSVPCDCGLKFDDAWRMTFYPHQDFSGQMTDEKARQLIAECLE